MRKYPARGTTLRPYDPWRRSPAVVEGYAKSKITGEKLIKLRHTETGRRTMATLRHVSRTFKSWA